MPREEIKIILARHRGAQMAVARAYGASQQTVCKWLSGSMVSARMEIACRRMATHLLAEESLGTEGKRLFTPGKTGPKKKA